MIAVQVFQDCHHSLQHWTQSVDLLQEKEKESNGKTNTPVNRRKPWDCGSLKIKLENKKKPPPLPDVIKYKN